ncbi:hypothetical protein ACFYWY_00030 [Streptomyces sp. NPDC002870]|uniref:hypothetical protein n=1 Tax=Streptomyces sp. NPDC002870 TaxID=3364666 RepID=UPI00368EDE65
MQILDSDQLQAAFGAVLAQPLLCGSRRLLGGAHGGSDLPQQFAVVPKPGTY